MATLASTNITTALSAGGETPVMGFGDSGLLVEVFRVAGGTVGDTIAITPRFITDIRSAMSGNAASHALSTTAANTNITLTLIASVAASSVSDVWLYGRR